MTEPERELNSRAKVMCLTVGLDVGGTEGQILELASRLDRRRFDVVVCALKGDGLIAAELRERGVRVALLRGRGKWDPRVMSRLFRHLRRERPDVLHGFLFRANLLSAVLGRLVGVPVVILSQRETPLRTGWLRRLIEQMTTHLADAVTCSSEAARLAAVARAGGPADKYVTIHNGIDLDRFEARSVAARAKLGVPDGVPVIGTVSRLDEPIKGLSVLLEAMGRLIRQARFRDLRAVIVGDGPAAPMLRERSERLGLARQVVFTGIRRDLPDILAVPDVYVQPSLSEGFGIAIVEAMAAGRPVVATRVGGIPEVVLDGKTGRLVPPGDAAMLATAIQELLQDRQRALEFGTAGRHRAMERFGIESMVEQHARLYQRLVGRAAGSTGTRDSGPAGRREGGPDRRRGEWPCS